MSTLSTRFSSPLTTCYHTKLNTARFFVTAYHDHKNYSPVYLFIRDYNNDCINNKYNICVLYLICNGSDTVHINALYCLRTLVPPKGRGGMLSGRLKYIIYKKFKRINPEQLCLA
jgi:hypothetical protein